VQLRRVRFKNVEGKTLVFLTNNAALPALIIAALYVGAAGRSNCFFKWIKQHPHIKHFIGNSDAVKTQVWCAITTDVLIAIVKKELQLEASLYTLLQILSVSVFNKIPLLQAFAGSALISEQTDFYNQLVLFDY